MKKLKKFLGVFAVALLLMSMSSYNLLKKDIDCFEVADIYANDAACEINEQLGIPVSHETWFQAWEIGYLACNNGMTGN